MRPRIFGYNAGQYGQFPYNEYVEMGYVGLPIVHSRFVDGAYEFYSKWVEEEKVTADQHRFAGIAYVSELASDPLAELHVEYADDPDGGPDGRAGGNDITNKQTVTRISGVPQDRDFYRAVLRDYTDNNTVQDVNVGFIH